MSVLHEYSVIGHSRATVGRWLGVTAGLAVSLLATILASIAALAKAKGFWESNSIYLIPITATTFYSLGHLAFDRWGWRKTIIHKLIGVPCLDGKWECKGETLDPKTGEVIYEWDAEVAVSQRWEKIVVTAATKQSSSRSISASLLKTEGSGFTLMYSYKNDPKIGEPELHSHIGYAQWQISEDLSSADAFYFNNMGRVTSGRMTLRKR